MTYNADFWMAAATIAPVVGLGHAVNLGATRRLVADTVTRAGEAHRATSRAAVQLRTPARSDRLDKREAAVDGLDVILDGLERSLTQLQTLATRRRRLEWPTNVGFGACAVALVITLSALVARDDLVRPLPAVTAVLLAFSTATFGVSWLLVRPWQSLAIAIAFNIDSSESLVAGDQRHQLWQRRRLIDRPLPPKRRAPTTPAAFTEPPPSD